ncbi:rod shape-determining protein [Caproiciproducens galactitolivorans]|uniref:Cell shape-determining protein MreB n=1 Tax=Caproiciproducens galactitolivorans TaxID=642589 RepID=A0ABT4BTI7_9FIRM|nr:rod shape-determining protein [Caproiciproducens galactitolivorans]MCY1714207.1 rod shape-determining protein [Caproiciproducens galactitolivorans]
MLGTDIAIDLGTSAVKIYLDGKGIILNEPAIVAVNVETDEIVATGSEAYKMIGRTSDKIDVVHPLCNGVISNFDLAQHLISTYLKKISGSKVFMPRVVVSVPCQITEVEKRAVVDAISAAGVRKICLIEEPVAAAMGAGVNIATPHGTLIVDIGGGTTDMAVLSLSGIAISRSIKVAGNAFDEAVIKYIRKKYNLIIGQRTAEDAKIAIGCVYPRKELVSHRVKGRNAMTGLPQWADISCDEMLEALIEPAMQIVRTIQEMLEKTPPELMGDVYSDGIILTGGSAQLAGFDTLISKKAKMAVHIAEDSQICVALGAGKAIQFIDDIQNKGYGILNPLSAAY